MDKSWNYKNKNKHIKRGLSLCKRENEFLKKSLILALDIVKFWLIVFQHLCGKLLKFRLP